MKFSRLKKAYNNILQPFVDQAQRYSVLGVETNVNDGVIINFSNGVTLDISVPMPDGTFGLLIKQTQSNLPNATVPKSNLTEQDVFDIIDKFGSMVYGGVSAKYTKTKKKANVDPNTFLDYAKQFGVTDSTVINVTDVAFRFTNGWSLYIGEDSIATDGTELFWCNTMTPMGEDIGSAWKMTFDAVLQYIQMVGLRAGV